MVPEIVGSVLGSLGGATIIVGAFAKFLGKIWAERITAEVIAKHTRDLEILKSRQSMAIEDFRHSAERELKDTDIYGGISQKIYQEFLERRIETYTRLLVIKNKYITDMQEEFVIEEVERWGDVYVEIFKLFRQEITTKQLYVSTELDKAFHALRMAASEFLKEADRVEAYGLGGGVDPQCVAEDKNAVYQRLLTDTSGLMQSLVGQLDIDIGKLRSRIDLGLPLISRTV